MVEHEIPPVFYRNLSPSDATIRKYQSMARVPMTVSCLWATGLSLFFLGFVVHRGNLYVHTYVQQIPSSRSFMKGSVAFFKVVVRK